jgi:hypothetical protein
MAAPAGFSRTAPFWGLAQVANIALTETFSAAAPRT